MANLDPAFEPLKKLIGTWKMNGRTLDSDTDNVSGEITFEPILGGAYMQSRAHLKFNDSEFDAIEIIHYDKAHKVYPSLAYANGQAGSPPVSYEWSVKKDGTIVHSGAGATYHGIFSEGDKVLAGGWRPIDDKNTSSEAAYDATMTRIA